jgi:putative copper export protein/mono/diheme cytochrome c family protein/peroxiredoxin
MLALTVAARWAHFAAAIALFGEFVFLLGVARPAFATAPEALAGERTATAGRTRASATWAVAAALLSAVAWLAAQAAEMSGHPLRRVLLDAALLRTVLLQTLFGRVWLARVVLAIALGALLLLARRNARNGPGGWPAGGALSAAFLVALVWMGHGNAESGPDHVVHLVADALHLLAAGAWLGALAPLASFLARARSARSAAMTEAAARAVRRFSVLGATSVALLVLSGTVNAGYTVGSVPALIGTEYGRLLLLKLALFGAMLALAAANRLRHAPQILTPHRSAAPCAALRRLERNAAAEAALGLAAVGVVAALGISIPAEHTQIVWPLSWTFDWDEVGESVWMEAAVLASAAVALAGLIACGVRARRRDRAIGVLGFCAGLTACAGMLAVRAHPTTYVRSPTPYGVVSIASGARLYAQNCVVCHGVHGYGDGPAAGALPMKPADLTEHISHHREGDLFWWLQHGIAGTPMPSFGDRIAENGLWDLINFLRAQGDAEAAKTMDASIEPWRPIPAPDFVFQIGSRPQESLSEQRGRRVVLLVLYTLPGSMSRLQALSKAQASLENAGARVIALPMHDGPPRPDPQGIPGSILADPDRSIAAAYAIYRRNASRVPAPPAHLEFLIDVQGYLRARWVPGESPGWDRLPWLLRQIASVSREKPHPAVSSRHVH